MKLCLEAGNDEYIILCNFSGGIMSGFEVKEGGSPWSQEAKKSPVWIGFSTFRTKKNWEWPRTEAGVKENLETAQSNFGAIRNWSFFG